MWGRGHPRSSSLSPPPAPRAASDTDGRASIERVTPDAAGAGSTLTLGVAELAAISLGGVSVATLAAAGRVRASDPEPAARVFGWHTSPRLSFWY